MAAGGHALHGLALRRPDDRRARRAPRAGIQLPLRRPRDPADHDAAEERPARSCSSTRSTARSIAPKPTGTAARRWAWCWPPAGYPDDAAQGRRDRRAAEGGGRLPRLPRRHRGEGRQGRHRRRARAVRHRAGRQREDRRATAPTRSPRASASTACSTAATSATGRIQRKCSRPGTESIGVAAMDTSVTNYLTGLQDRIVGEVRASLTASRSCAIPGSAPRAAAGVSRLIEEGNLFERGGVSFSHVIGTKLPPSASAHRPELAGRPCEAMGVSLVLHPRNPYVPTVHMNVRFFVAKSPRRRGEGRCGGSAAAWTSRRTTASRRTASHFHRACNRDALAPFGRRVPSALQEMVRRVLLPQAPQGAARHRRHLLRRLQRAGLRRRASR